MKSEQIQYFLEAVELGSMLRVAEQHYLSQPAVSLAISNLEKELDVQLLVRSRQGITLTEAGKVAKNYFEKMEEILTELEAALIPYQICSIHEEEVLLKMCATIECNNSIVKELLHLYSRQYPNSMFSLKEYDFLDMMRSVGRARYDIGIYCIIEEVFSSEYIQRLIIENNLKCTTLETNQLHVILAKTSPLIEKETVSIKDVLKNPLVIYNSSEDRCWHDLFLERYHYKGRVVRTNSITYLSSVVREKGYIAFYLNRRRSVAKTLTNDFVIRPVKEPISVLTGVMCRKDIKRTPEMIDLLQCLDKVMANNMLEKQSGFQF